MSENGPIIVFWYCCWHQLCSQTCAIEHTGLSTLNTTPPKGQHVMWFLYIAYTDCICITVYADLCLGYTISNINCSSKNIAKVICNWLTATSTTAKPIALSGGLQMLLGERMGAEVPPSMRSAIFETLEWPR